MKSLRTPQRLLHRSLSLSLIAAVVALAIAASLAVDGTAKAESHVVLTATVHGSIVPPQIAKVDIGHTISNGDFVIERTGKSRNVGNGKDEATIWRFDLAADPDFAGFQDAVMRDGLGSALLTLVLIPQSRSISTDVLNVGHLPMIGISQEEGGAGPFDSPPLHELPLNTASTVEIELLDFYTSSEILSVLRNAPAGQVPMRYSDDAIVFFAQLELTTGMQMQQAQEVP